MDKNFKSLKDIDKSLNKTSNKLDNLIQNIEINMEMVLDSVNMGIWSWNLIDDSIIVNEAMFTLFCLDKKDFDGTVHSFFKKIHPEDLKGVNLEIESCIKHELPYIYSFRVICPHNRISRLKGKGNVTYDENKNSLKMLGVTFSYNDLHL